MHTVLAWIFFHPRSQGCLEFLFDRNGCCSSRRHPVPRSHWSFVDLVSLVSLMMFVDLLINVFFYHRATLSTSCLITMVGQMLRIPITTILSGSSEELTTLFWLGFLGICFSLASLTVFTNWTLIDSNVHYSFWNTSTSKRASKNEEKECLTLTQES